MNDYLSPEAVEHIAHGRLDQARAEIDQFQPLQNINALRVAILDGDVDTMRFLLPICTPHINQYLARAWEWVMMSENIDILNVMVDMTCSEQGQFLRECGGFSNALNEMAGRNHLEQLERLYPLASTDQITSCLVYWHPQHNQAKPIFIHSLQGRGAIINAAGMYYVAQHFAAEDIECIYHHCSADDLNKTFKRIEEKRQNLRTGPINEGQQYFVTLHQAMMQRQEIADQVQGTKDEEPPTRKVKM